MTPTEADFERRAVRRVKARLGWRLHLSIYVVINLGLWGLAASQGKHWNYFPLAGWGLGLALHGLAIRLREGAWFTGQVEAERQRLHDNAQR